VCVCMYVFMHVYEIMAVFQTKNI